MKKKRILVVLLTIIVLVCVIIAFYTTGNKQDNILTYTVQMGSIEKTIEETGTIFSKNVSTFYTDMSQKVNILNVSIGDEVKKGDIILAYDNNIDFEIERINKQIDEITAAYNESSTGTDFRELSNAKLNISTIENSLEFAKSNLEKLKILYENNAISKIEYDEVNNNVKALENQLQEANNNYALLIKGVSSNVKKQYESQIGALLIQTKLLEKNKENTVLKAEFDGVITELNVSLGGMTRSLDKVVEIQDIDNLGIYMELLSEDAFLVLEDMQLEIKNENLGINVEGLVINKIYPKAVSKVSELGVEQKRVRVEADFVDNSKHLKIGSEVDATIKLEQKDNVLLVEKEAIYKSESKEYVTVIENGNEIEKEITTGIKSGDYVEVLDGLEENDIVKIK